MKKTITMLLLTALCVTAFASCDLGNGLVAELFGDVKDLTIGEQIYPFEDYIVVGTDMIVDIPAIEIETTLPYEIETAYDTIEEYWSEDVTTEIYPVEELLVYEIRAIECHYADGMYEWTPSDGDLFSESYELHLRYDTVSVAFSGVTQMFDVAFPLGYRIGDMYMFDDSFWSDAHHDEDIWEYRDFRITIPADQLEDGYNELTFVYECYGQMIELGTVPVFKEVPTTAGEDTAIPDVQETAVESETELEPEIEFPEINIDD